MVVTLSSSARSGYRMLIHHHDSFRRYRAYQNYLHQCRPYHPAKLPYYRAYGRGGKVINVCDMETLSSLVR